MLASMSLMFVVSTSISSLPHQNYTEHRMSTEKAKVANCVHYTIYNTSKLKILQIKKREYRDGIKRKETRLGWS